MTASAGWSSSACDDAQVELAADRRADRQRLAGELGDAREAAQDDVRDAVGHADRLQRAGLRLRAALDDLGLDERAQRFLHEERVALGLLAQAAHERGARRGAEARGDERVGLALGQPDERDAIEALLAARSAMSSIAGCSRAQLDAPRHAEHEQARRVGMAQQVAQEQQRRAVDPVQVVEHEQQRARSVDARDEPRDRLEEAVALGLRIGCRRRPRPAAARRPRAPRAGSGRAPRGHPRTRGSAARSPWRSSWRRASMNGW